MDQSQSRTIRYAVAGFCGLALLLLLGWLVLRENASTSDQSVGVATVTPSAPPATPLFTPDEEVSRKTPTNQVAEVVTNAATIYRQAFALFDALSKEEKDLIRGGATNVDASVAAELCGKIQPICDLMHQAAAVSNCDWGVEQPITVTTRFPYLQSSRDLARAAVWSVAHCRTNDPSSAVDDLIATSRLGQNVSSPATVIAHLVNLAIQGLVVESAAGHASLLASTGDTRLAELLNDANYVEGLRRAYVENAGEITRIADELAALPPEEAMRELMQVGDDGSASRIQSMGPAQAIADIRQVTELERQFANALELPEDQYQDWMTGLEAVRSTNPFVDMLFTPTRVVDKTQAMTVQSTMAAAGLAIMQDGPDALQSHPDPSTGQAFTYTETDDGFTLESTFQLNGKSVKLSFK